MQIHRSFKTILFLFATVFQPLFSASYELYQGPYYPTQAIHEVHDIDLNTVLCNTGTTLGNLLLSGGLMPSFTIQKITDGMNVSYLYNTTFDSRNPFLVGTYAFRLVTDSISVFPEVVGYCPQIIPSFTSYAHAPKHSPYSTHNYFQPVPSSLPQSSLPTMPLPTIHPIIRGALEGRKLALIDLIKKTNITSKAYLERTPTHTNWCKILKVACEDFEYPFTALDLSFPSQEEVRNTPQQVPYVPEDELEKMKAEYSLESTNTARKIFLKNKIDCLSEFLDDMKKPHPLAHGNTQSSHIMQSPPASATALTPQPSTIEASAQEQQQVSPKQVSPDAENSPKIVPPVKETLAQIIAHHSTPTQAQAKTIAPNQASKQSIVPTATHTTTKKQSPTNSLPTTVAKKIDPKPTVVSTSLPTQKKSAFVALPSSTPPQTQVQARRDAPVQSTAAPQPTPNKGKKSNKETFLNECLEAATTNTVPPLQKDPHSSSACTLSPIEDENPNAFVELNEPSKSSHFEKKAAAAEQYRLKKLAQTQKKLEETALAAAEQEQCYATLEKACEEKNYELAIKTLHTCDQKTERFGAALILLVNHLASAKARNTFPQLNDFILHFLDQKKCPLSNDQKSHLLLHLGLQDDNETRLSSLQKAAELGNIVAEAELLVIQAKEFINPHSKKCTAGKRCPHKKIARFFVLHGEKQSIKHLLCVYKLSLYAIQSGCQNIELSIPIEELYPIAKVYLTPEDYDTFLSLSPLPLKEPIPSDLTAPSSQSNTFPNLEQFFEKNFENFFKKFYAEVKSIYVEPQSKAITQGLIRSFFINQTSTEEQVLYVFTILSVEPELAIFYETLHEIMKSKEPLPFMSQKVFKALSASVAQSLATSVTKISKTQSNQAVRAILYLQDIQSLANSLNAPFLQTVTLSDSRFVPLLLEIFGAYKAFTVFKASKESSALGKPYLKKSIGKIVAQEKEKVTALVVTVLKTVKTEADVREFTAFLNKFRAHEFYSATRSMIDAYLSTIHNEQEKEQWRLYTILPDPSKFRSLEQCEATGSFALRCNLLKIELDEYFKSAPSKTEIFRATEELMVKFLSTSQSLDETTQFITTFKSHPALCFCIGGLLTHAAHYTTEQQLPMLPLFEMLKKHLTRQIECSTQSPLHDYIINTQLKIEAFLQGHTPPKNPLVIIEFSSLNMGAAIPFETVFTEFKRNLNAFSEMTPIQDLITFKKTFIMQLFEKAHTFANLKTVIEETITDVLNGPLYFDVFLEFSEKKTIEIPETEIIALARAFKPLLDEQVIAAFSKKIANNTCSTMQPAHLVHYFRYLHALQIKVTHLCN